MSNWCYLVQADGLIFDGCQYAPGYEGRGWTIVLGIAEADALAVNASRHHSDNGPLRWRWDGAAAVEVVDSRPTITIAAHGTESGLDMPAVPAGTALRLVAVATDAAGDPADISGRHWVRVMFNERRWVVGVDFVGDTADVHLPIQHPGVYRIESHGAAHILRGDVEFAAVVIAPPYAG